jgi:competence protein ComEC
MGGLARVWLALAGLVGGVLCAALGTGVAAAVALAGATVGFRRRGPWRVAGLVAVAFACGVATAALRAVERQPAFDLARSIPSCEVTGRTLEEAGGLGLLASADHVDCGDVVLEDAGVVFLDDVALAPARRFVATGWLVPLRDGGFDGARKRAGAAAAFAATDAEDLGAAGRVHALAHRVRDGLARAAAPLGAPGALLRGLTIGDTGGLDRRTEDVMRRSGLAHLLAVSGSNVAILLGAVAWVLAGAAPVVRTVSCAVALVLFVAVVGPDPSVVRAAGMGAIALVAIASGRRAEPLHALGLALVAALALRPGLVYSAGLHLSAAATLGLVLWSGPLAARVRRLPRAIALVVGATVAAQAAVAPLLVATFGQLPVAGLVANLLALPAVAPATILGLAAGAAGTVADAPAAFLARAAAPFAAWILRVGQGLGEPAWATVNLPPFWGWVLAVPAVVAAARALPRRLSPPRDLETPALTESSQPQ